MGGGDKGGISWASYLYVIPPSADSSISPVVHPSGSTDVETYHVLAVRPAGLYSPKIVSAIAAAPSRPGYHADRMASSSEAAEPSASVPPCTSSPISFLLGPSAMRSACTRSACRPGSSIASRSCDSASFDGPPVLTNRGVPPMAFAPRPSSTTTASAVDATRAASAKPPVLLQSMSSQPVAHDTAGTLAATASLTVWPQLPSAADSA